MNEKLRDILMIVIATIVVFSVTYYIVLHPDFYYRYRAAMLTGAVAFVIISCCYIAYDIYKAKKEQKNKQ